MENRPVRRIIGRLTKTRHAIACQMGARGFQKFVVRPFEFGSTAPDILYVSDLTRTLNVRGSNRTLNVRGSNRTTMAGLAAEIAADNRGEDPKVVNLAYSRIKKSLKSEGFDLITDDQGKLTLVLRLGR